MSYSKPTYSKANDLLIDTKDVNNSFKENLNALFTDFT